MQETVFIKHDLKYQEFFDLTLYVFFKRKRVKRFLIYVGIVLIGVNILSYKVLTDFSIVMNSLLILTPFIAIPIVFCAMIFVGSFIYYKRYPANFHNGTYEFTHWGMTKILDGSEVSRPWRDFQKVKETRQFFLFYVADYNIHVVQKRMFENAEDISSFRNMIEEKVENFK